jgi:hypothetical protein
LAAAWILDGLAALARKAGGRAQPDDAHGASCAQCLFQWVNPKLWAITLAAASGYGLGLTPWEEAQRLAFAFSGINLFVCLFWAFTGALLSHAC